MALFVPGGALQGGTVSGKVGGIVFSRNRFGAYVRSRVVPVNPNSVQQQAVRALMQSMVTAWDDVLTAIQRSGWTTWAANVPKINRIGLSVVTTGLNAYVSMNVFRLQAGNLSRIDDPPSIFNLATFTPVVIGATETSQQFSCAYDNSDDWATEDGGAISVYVSRPANPTINFFSGPYRFAGQEEGAVVPPTSPLTGAAPFLPLVQGQKLFYRVNVCRADGRLSVPQFTSSIVGA